MDDMYLEAGELVDLPTLRAYVATLDQDIQRLYQAADRCILEASDTLSDEFQIASVVMAAFMRRASAWSRNKP